MEWNQSKDSGEGLKSAHATKWIIHAILPTSFLYRGIAVSQGGYLLEC